MFETGQNFKSMIDYFGNKTNSKNWYIDTCKHIQYLILPIHSSIIYWVSIRLRNAIFFTFLKKKFAWKDLNKCLKT